MKLKIKRVYEKPDKDDGIRILVDRLWSRGLTKEKAKVDVWLKDIAPSTTLRKWFGHDPKKWGKFQRKYFAELNTRPDAWEPILKAAKRGAITLLYSSHDTEHNNAVALKGYLEAKLTHASARGASVHE